MKALRVLVAGLALALAAGAHTGQACEAPQPPSASAVTEGMALAQRTSQALDASGAQVVLLARAGQDLRRYGLQWSHLGFAYRSTDAQGRPAWRVVHKLNRCGTDRAGLYRQGLGDFFLDQPWRYEAAFVVPTPEVQAKLRPWLDDSRRLPLMHTAAYSMLAYPWSERYQQSNQWALETLAAALDDGATDRHRAQAWLQLRGYQPTVLNIDAFTRLGARATRANIAFDDHPNSKRFADHIETVTADSMFSWLAGSQLAGAPQLVR
ncbi:DUF2145 domain-containing protein [Ideonella azotifigens]|uniref:DUF2145 domain-containing protein n=2 Tax=Ideonella azotifigens TaxID=513160 RepID=A0ABN1JPF4_9BURK|nr:DUF2145 domain-containing protein [Ideonella azotifigens]MCD2339970.1 DUF2145 domain-containing protein [Ideonella azotifigens]